ncbi:MAG: tRNA lysidine(34) synthetase TilS [Pseudomonadota bacterium]|nr:tRNA lysidine(34) synthetase TilS [Pseudomonadota bacterium]
MDATRKSRSPERPAGGDPVSALAHALLDAGLGAGSRLCVAYSGGLDSTALLHALCLLRPALGFDLAAVHVDHRLHPDSASWADHCRRQTASRDVPLTVLEVRVAGGAGIEAAARTARYAALAGIDCDRLLFAHQRDDQAETVLLALLRGAGPAGLAAMGADAVRPGHPLGQAPLRPWLGIERSALLQWAQTQGLAWIEDPSNQDLRLDRNFLRQTIGPALGRRFPGWRAALARSAQWAAESQQLLEELALQDLAALGPARPDADPCLLPGSCTAWCALSGPRARNLLRLLLAQRGLGAPPAARLLEWWRQLGAGHDRLPELAWAGVVLRRWGGRLWLEPQLPSPDLGGERLWSPDGPALHIAHAGELSGALSACGTAGAGPGVESPSVLRAGCGPLLMTPCRGSEHLHLHAGGPGRELRKLFQERGIPPWRRLRMPALRAGGRLAAVAGLGVAAEFQAAPGAAGWRILWQDAAVSQAHHQAW